MENDLFGNAIVSHFSTNRLYKDIKIISEHGNEEKLQSERHIVTGLYID